MKILCSLLLCLAVLMGNAQSHDFRNESLLLKTSLDQHHIKPATLDNIFSHQVLEILLDQLDPAHLYFNSEDAVALRRYDAQLDDEWLGQGWNFLPELTTRYHNARLRGSKFLSEEALHPIDWHADESFILRGKEAPWNADEGEQRKRMREWIKYKVLSSIRRNHHVDSLVKSGGINYLTSHEDEWRKRVGAIEGRRVRRILENPNGFDNVLAAQYFRQVSGWYDPHTLYFAPWEYEKFKEGLTTKSFAFGFNLGQDDDGNIIVAGLKPGGPAWKAGMHQRDMLLSISWEGKEPFDLTGIGLDDFLELLDHSNPPAAAFSVQDQSGLQKKLFIRKEKIGNDDNTVRGFVLAGETKVGYISLPGFYTEWESDDKSSCANDVAAEIMKLKGEGIEALILDIRFNVGGALKEAIGMGGIFIDEGAIAMINEKNGTTISLRDFSRGVVYDGPLLLMVNGQSASASEILAAALQDYHRAVVVGSPTYGKATGQQVFPLDPTEGKSKTVMGYVAVTEMRIYRVTGKSNQGTGLLPDILLPDLTEVAGEHEDDQPRAFTKDSTNRKSYFKPLKPLKLDLVRQSSQARISNVTAFNQINQWKAEAMSAPSDTVATVLSIAKFPEVRDMALQLLADHQNGSSPLFSVMVPAFNSGLLEMDAYKKDQTEIIKKVLSGDPWIQETFRIALDYIRLK